MFYTIILRDSRPAWLPPGSRPITASQARVVDPVLTNHAQGYKQPKFVGHLLFPSVEVLTRGGKVIEFNKDAFRRHNARRAPGANAAQIDFGYSGKPFDLGRIVS